MKILQNILIVAVLSLFAQFFLPWWIIALVGFLMGYFAAEKGWQAFLAGFVGVFIVWFAYAFWIDVNNNHLLSSKVIQLFHLPSSIAIILLTALIGGLVAGFAALTGRLLKVIA